MVVDQKMFGNEPSKKKEDRPKSLMVTYLAKTWTFGKDLYEHIYKLLARLSCESMDEENFDKQVAMYMRSWDVVSKEFYHEKIDKDFIEEKKKEQADMKNLTAA
jgi:hypothetical protein